ncbi:MAG TPA: helix-turn-helix domain-containing GNAT family N-acetyltransferase [Kofleriaceae bacterium]|jgi:DNA-binding MarR family transcriptional regulator/GNAT superfamily N-acetyltransferase|nr:helix-turn-helix domain-containing GNAT family N-acetyltransferase [Kofleriaceae bacterium]
MISLPPATTDRVAALRAFNRFWTARIGALDGRLLASRFSLSEARVLYELAQRDSIDTGELKAALRMDAGYLSRILSRFRREGLAKTPYSRSDRRRQTVEITGKGRAAFRDLDARSNDDVRALLANSSEDAQRSIATALASIRRMLGEPVKAPRAYVLRAPHAGDLGWVVERHGAIYAREYGWNDEFEALVARIVADYVAKRDPDRDAAWIAELDGERVGCIFCVAKSEKVAQLRLLLVEPSARGIGVGARLVAECVAHARRCGFDKLVLWTNDVLTGARKLYEAAGFELVASGKHRAFGRALVEQTWELPLR